MARYSPISQVTGNHPTSTKLSTTKHIFDPGPTYDSRYIFWTRKIYASSVSIQVPQPNASNIKELKLVFIKTWEA
jgi:hypothetical protein